MNISVDNLDEGGGKSATINSSSFIVEELPKSSDSTATSDASNFRREKGKKTWNSNVVLCVSCSPVRALSPEAVVVDGLETVFLMSGPLTFVVAAVKVDRRFAAIIDLSSNMVPIPKTNLASPNALRISAGVHSCR